MDVSANGVSVLSEDRVESEGGESCWKNELACTRVAAAACFCMDFRFCFRLREPVRKFLEIGDGQYYDSLAMPGGAYGFVRPDTDDPERLELWKAHKIVGFKGIDIAVNKHGVRKMAFLDHEKCGMCADDGHVFQFGIQHFQTERNFHFNRLRAAADEVHRVFPGLDIPLGFIYLSRDGKILIDKVQY